MFQRLIQWIREVFNKMIGQSSIKQALNVDVAISSAMSSALTEWALAYTNQSDWLNNDVRGLNLPSAIAGEIARAVTIELKCSVEGSARAKYLQQQIDRVLPKLREQVEYGCALGGLVFKPYVSGGQVFVDFVRADNFLPVAFDGNGRITAIVFVDQKQVGDQYYTRLEYHRLDGTNYSVQNLAYRSSQQSDIGRPVNLSALPEWAQLQPVTFMEGIQKPLYGYFRYPLANNIEPGSPLGVSCYARALDLIKEADLRHYNLCWEFESGKRAIYVDALAFGKDAKGRAILPDRRLYRAVDTPGSNIGDGNKLFEEWSPQFREASILSGLNDILKRIEMTCGLAFGTLSDPQAVERTATEIASAKQRSASTIVDCQKSLKTAIEDLVYAMDAWATMTPSLGLSVPRGTYNVTMDFDDSLIVDRAAQRMEDKQDVGLGVMSKWRYLMLTRGLSEEEAKAWIAEAESEKPEPMFPPPGA